MSEDLSENQELTPEEQKAQVIERQKQELLRRRENGELEPYDYDINYIWYRQEMGQAVRRQDVGNHVILIRPDQFKTLGYLEFISADGENVILDLTDENFDTSNPLIIFPEELGEKKTEQLE